MSQGIDFQEIHEEVVTNLSQPLESIILPDAKVDLGRLLDYMFAQFNGIEIQVTDEVTPDNFPAIQDTGQLDTVNSLLDKFHFSAWWGVGDIFDSFAGQVFEYEPFHGDDKSLEKRVEELREQNKKPFVLLGEQGEGFIPIIRTNQRSISSISTERKELRITVFISSKFTFRDIPSLLFMLEEIYRIQYGKAEIVPKYLVWLQNNLEKLFTSMEVLSQQFAEKSKGLLSRLSLHTTHTPDTKKIRKSISKRAYFYFCLSRAFLWEDVFSDSEKTSQEFEQFFWPYTSQESSDSWEVVEVQKEKGAFMLEATTYIEANDELGINNLELFIQAVEDYFKDKQSLDDPETSVYEKNKDLFLDILAFPKIQKKLDGEYETYSEYARRAILEIAAKLDLATKESDTLNLSDLDIAERALSYEHRDIVFDEMMDYMRDISKRENIREWDIVQIVSIYFPHEKLKELLWNIGMPEDGIRMFDSVEQAKQELQLLRLGILKEIDPQKKEQLQKDLEKLERDIAMIVSFIVYSNMFCSYENTLDNVIYDDRSTRYKTNMCFWQWWMVDNVLRGVFWIETYAIWFDTEGFSHFVTMLKSWNYRTDGFSSFNLERDTRFDSLSEVGWDYMKVIWDVESVNTSVKYDFLIQNTNLDNNYDVNINHQINKQIPWFIPTYIKLWFWYLSKWDYAKALIYFRRAEALFTHTIDSRMYINMMLGLAHVLYELWSMQDSLVYCNTLLLFLEENTMVTDKLSIYIKALFIKIVSEKNLFLAFLGKYLREEESINIVGYTNLREKFLELDSSDLKVYLWKSWLSSEMIDVIFQGFRENDTQDEFMQTFMLPWKYVDILTHAFKEKHFTKGDVEELPIHDSMKHVLMWLLPH